MSSYNWNSSIHLRSDRPLLPLPKDDLNFFCPRKMLRRRLLPALRDKSLPMTCERYRWMKNDPLIPSRFQRRPFQFLRLIMPCSRPWDVPKQSMENLGPLG